MKNEIVLPAFKFNATEYLASAEVTMMTLEQEGLYIRALVKAAIDGDKDTVESFPFAHDYDPNCRRQRHRRYIAKSIRRKILSIRKCAYCGSPDNLQVDHIIPVARGGCGEEHNLQPLCRPCNQRKAARLV